ncbi:MAG TPA: hypothetical protein VHH34_08635 [Pseudonocardiaceae bacterium]|nr:hypothetical protein [Pseudonocardiaceae bacterium]
MSAPGVTLLEVTDTAGTTHLVTDEAMAAGRAAGRYLARCDAVILAASLTTPESRPCRACCRRAGR